MKCQQRRDLPVRLYVRCKFDAVDKLHGELNRTSPATRCRIAWRVTYRTSCLPWRQRMCRSLAASHVSISNSCERCLSCSRTGYSINTFPCSPVGTILFSFFKEHQQYIFLVTVGNLHRRWRQVLFRSPSVCLFVCLIVNSITQKVTVGFSQNLGNR